MNLADEITINQIKQELISQEDAKNWFLSFPTEGQQEILQWLSYMTLQARAREEDVSLAIAKSKLRPTYTPCVLLSRGRLKEQMAKLLKLPPSESIKTFFLLQYFGQFGKRDALRAELQKSLECEPNIQKRHFLG